MFMNMRVTIEEKAQPRQGVTCQLVHIAMCLVMILHGSKRYFWSCQAICTQCQYTFVCVCLWFANFMIQQCWTIFKNLSNDFVFASYTEHWSITINWLKIYHFFSFWNSQLQSETNKDFDPLEYVELITQEITFPIDSQVYQRGCWTLFKKRSIIRMKQLKIWSSHSGPCSHHTCVILYKYWLLRPQAIDQQDTSRDPSGQIVWSITLKNSQYLFYCILVKICTCKKLHVQRCQTCWLLVTVRDYQ